MPVRAKKKKAADKPAGTQGSARPLRDVLIAVTGTSPAIVTETIWALAREQPAIIPDEVVIVTTTRGAEVLQRQILTPRADWGNCHVWETLRAAILGPNAATDPRLQLAEPRLIEIPDRRTGVRRLADDLRTVADNNAAADFLLEEVRRHAENPDTRIIASIAGGRKTMGALLYAALTLLGRETDRLTHVLAPDPFDTARDFYFPAQPVKTVTVGHGTEARRIAVKDCCIELADIPFVPLRNRFTDLGQKPGTFRHLVERYSSDLKTDAGCPVRVSFDVVGKVLHLDSTPIRMRPRAQIILRFLVESRRFPGQLEAAADFDTWRRFLDKPTLALCPATISSDDFRRELNHLKTAAIKAGCRWPVAPRSLDFTRFEIV